MFKKLFKRKNSFDKEIDNLSEQLSETVISEIEGKNLENLSDEEIYDMSEQVAIKAMQAIDPGFVPPKVFRFFSVEDIMNSDLEEIRTELLNQLADGKNVAEILVHGK